MQRRIVITPGDPDGVGPEILSLLQRARRLPKGAEYLIVGSLSALRRHGARAHPVSERDPFQRSGPSGSLAVIPTDEATHPGAQSGWAVDVAIRLIQRNKADALVTGPIHKARLREGGYLFSGHTDLLADRCGVREVTMMLANSKLRSSLVTTHLPLSSVASHITAERLTRTILQTHAALQKWWKIAKPRIGVAGLNPHAGESGVLGREEIDVILPTLEKIRKHHGSRLTLEGPFPSDTLFVRQISAPRTKRYDAIVSMYHDQGLIPVKLLDFPNTVNVTLGLPIIRTSVDHGVAFDIVGTGRVDPSSMRAALVMAIDILKRKPLNRR